MEAWPEVAELEEAVQVGAGGEKAELGAARDEGVQRARFSHDWRRCLMLGAAGVIMKNDDDGHADVDGDGIPDEVMEVSPSSSSPCVLLIPTPCLS